MNVLDAVLSVITGGGALYLAFRTFGRDKTNDLTTRVGKLENTVQILLRREVWHERKEGILTDTLREHGIDVPPMPEPPEPYPSAAA